MSRNQVFFDKEVCELDSGKFPSFVVPPGVVQICAVAGGKTARRRGSIVRTLAVNSNVISIGTVGYPVSFP